MNKKYLFVVCVILLLIASLTITTAADTNTQTNTSVTKKTDNTHTTDYIQSNKIKSNSQDNSISTSKQDTASKIDESDTSSENLKNTNTTTSIIENKNTKFKDINKANKTETVKRDNVVTATTFDEFKNYIKNAEGPNLTIHFVSGTVYTVNSKDLYWNGSSKLFNLTIIGNGAIVDGNGLRFMEIGGERTKKVFFTLNMSNITFKNCRGNESNTHARQGGVIYGVHAPTVYISNCTFMNSSGIPFNENGGGAILVHRGNLTVTDSVFTDSSSETVAGAIRVFTSDPSCPDSCLTLKNVTFKNSTSVREGGTIFVSTISGTVNITDCTFESSSVNSTTINGGTIYVDRAKQLIIDNCNFTDNNATGEGAIYINTAVPGDTHIISNNIFTGNNATLGGAAIAVNYTTSLNVYGNVFTDNTAENGGAIKFVSASNPITLENNNFTNNNAENGGAIYSTTKVNSVNNIFNANNATQGGAVYTTSATSEFNGADDVYGNNTATVGGALYVAADSKVTSISGYFKNNTAEEYGGVVYVDNGASFATTDDVSEDNSAIRGGVIYLNDSTAQTVVVKNSNYTNNNATEGGVLYVEKGKIDSSGETFRDNRAVIGGAIYNLEGNVISTGNTLINNTAEIGGGAYIAKDAVLTKVVGNDENNSATIGGSIYNNGTFVSQGSTFTTNNATIGGAVFNNGTMSVSMDTFTGNNASLGGALYNNNTITANDNIFVGNNATNGGGLLDNGTFSGSGNNYYNNTAKENGGAVYSTENRNINIQTVHFEGNVAENGGAIFTEQNVRISSKNDVRYINNLAVNGGAIFLSNESILESFADEFIDNNATLGGAVFAQANNTVTIRGGSIVDSNNAEKGGVVYLNNTSELNLINSRYTNNNATEGSVVYANSGNNVTSSGNIYENNTATTGTIYLNENVKFSSSNDQFINNVAQDKGGAIYTKSNITTDNDVFKSNNATIGGAIYLDQNVLYDSVSDTFESNHATTNGGAIYVENNSIVDLTDDIFDLNNAVNGGAIYLVGNSNINSTRSNYRKNDAENGAVAYVSEDSTFNSSSDIFTTNNATIGGVFYNEGTINSSASTYTKSISTDKGSAVYNAPQGTFISDNDVFSANEGVTGSVIYNDGKTVVTQSTFDSNSATNSVIYNDNDLTLNNTNFKNNYITSNNQYVIYNNKDTASIVNNIFTNNTNNTHDILLGGVQPASITNNTYIDNYLNDTWTEPEIIDIDSDASEFYQDYEIILRSIYNDTVRNGTIKYTDETGETLAEGVVVNGTSTVKFFLSKIPKGMIPVNVTYTSFDKHYQDIKFNSTIIYGDDSRITLTGFNQTYVDDKFNITVSLYNSTLGYIYNQNVTVYVNGTKYVGNTTDKGYFVIEDLSFDHYGVYPINATYDGQDEHLPAQRNNTINIVKVPTHLVLNIPDNIEHPDDMGVINVTLYDSRDNTTLASKPVTLNITYKDLYSDLTNDTGSISYTFVAHERGNIDVQAFAPLSADVKYASPDEIMGRFVINRYTPHFHYTVTQIEHPEVENDVNITFTLYDEYHNIIPNKNVTLYIENSTGTFEINVTTNDTGEILVTQTVLANGDVNVTAVSVEDYKYREGSLPVHVKADVIYTFISVVPTNTYVNKTTEIRINLRDLSGNLLNDTVILTVGEYDPVEVEIINGTATYKNESMIWEYQQVVPVKAEYPGNDHYQGINATTEFSVFRIPTSTTIAVLQNLNTKSIFEINVTANETISDVKVNYGNVTIIANKTIDDQHTELIALGKVNLEDTDGHIIFETDQLTDVTMYRIIVQYDSNDIFFESSAITAMSTVSYKNTTITIDSSSPILVNQTDTIEFVLREKDTSNRLPYRNITIKINGTDGYEEIYENVTTDGNGRVVINAKFGEVGVYNITATYDGDTYYNSSVSLGNITVRQKTITIVSVVSPIHVLDNITCIVTLTDITGKPLAHQTVYVTDNDREGSFVTNESGQFAVEDIYYTSGLKNITARFMGTLLYIDSEGYDIILVQRLDTILTIQAESPVYVGNPTVISGYLTLANGTPLSGQRVYLTINGADEPISVITGDDGNYTYSYMTKPDEIGINNVTAEFRQDDVYYGFTDRTVFKVDNIITIISVEADRILKVGNTTVITGVLEDQFGNILPRQVVDVYINGEKVTDRIVQTDNSGIYTYDFTPKAPGIYNILVNYTGNATHRDSHDDYRIKVDKIITHMDVYSTTPVNMGDKITVTGRLYDEYGQAIIQPTISLLVNGTFIETGTTLSDGSFEFTYDAVSVGIQNITVVYDGTDDKYLPSNNTHQSNVLKIFTHFDEVEATNVKVDHNTTVTGRLIDENGNLMKNTPFTISFNDENPLNYITDDNGRFAITYNATEVGLNSLTLNYYGNDTHAPVSLSATFNVEKLDVYLNTNVTNLTSRNATLHINATDEDGAQVTGGFIFIYDEDDNLLNSSEVQADGTVTLNITVQPGLHNFNIFYNGTEDRYKTSNQAITINVPKHELNLTLENINDTKVRNTTNITGFLYDLDNNPVEGKSIEIYVNGDLKETIQTGADGNYTYVYEADTSGLMEVRTVFVGDDENATVERIGTFNVEKINTTIVLNQIEDTTVDNNVTITGILKDEFDLIIPQADITISINGINYTNITGLDGKFSYTFKTSVVGVNNITVYYNGNNTFNLTSNETTFTVNPHTTNVTASIPNPRPRSSLIEINVTDENKNNVPTGNIVIKENDAEIGSGIIVNGVLVTTVSLEPGEHTLLVEYEGITNYKANQTTYTVTIPRYETIIVPESINPVKLNETITIKGFLVDEFNSPVKDTSIIISINGHNATVPVDSDGRFSYTNTTNVTGTNNITYTYGGNTTHENSSAKIEFTVLPLSTTITVNTTVPVLINNNTTIAGVLKDEKGNNISGAQVEIWVNNKLNETVTTDENGSYNHTITVDTLGVNYVTVKYLGNDSYVGVDASTVFYVGKVNTTLTIVKDERTTYVSLAPEDTVYFNVTLKDQYGHILTDKDVTLVINNDTEEVARIVNTTDEYGVSHYYYVPPLAGNYYIYAFFNGTEDPVFLSNSSQIITIEPHKIPTEARLFNLTAYHTDANIKFESVLFYFVDPLNPDPVGNNVTIPNQKVNITMIYKDGTNETREYTTDENGKFIFEFTKQSGTDNFTIVFDYPGNNRYKSITFSKSFDDSITTFNTFIAAQDHVRINETNLLTYYVIDETEKPVSGTLNLTNELGELIASIPVTNGYAYYNYSSEVEKHVKITGLFYNDDVNYNKVPQTLEFDVFKIDSVINMNVLNNTVFNTTVEITVTNPYNESSIVENGEVIVKYGETQVGRGNIQDGRINITLSNMGEAKVYDLTLTYSGNSYFFNSANTSSVEVVKVPVTLTPQIISNYVADFVAVVHVTSDSGHSVEDGIVTLYDNEGNKVGTADVINGRATIYNTSISARPAEEFRAVFNNSAQFIDNETTVTTDVIKYPATITISDIITVEVNETVEINVTLKNSTDQVPLEGQQILVTFTDGTQQQLVTTNENGTASVTYNSTTDKTVTVTATLVENDIYTAEPVSDVFNVEKTYTILNATADSPIKVGSNTTIRGRLVADTKKPIENAIINITIRENKYNTTTDENGYYNYTLTDYPVGNYDVRVEFTGNEIYHYTFTETSFVVEKHESYILANNSDIVNGKTTITVNITDEDLKPVNGGFVNITENGEVIGNGTLTPEGLLEIDAIFTPGRHRLEIIYNGTENYTEASTVLQLTVPKYDPIIIVNDIEDTLVRNNTTISGYLVDENDEAIKDATLIIRVNDFKIATVITGEDGNYSVVYNATTIGEKDVTVSFEGNEMYAPTEGYGMFNVLPISTNVTVPEIEDTVIGNVVVINGTLTDELKQAVGNVEVIITVNGKNYTASTDDDGKYTYNYTTGTAGVNNITVTFIGDENIIGTVNETTFNVIKIATATVADIASPRAGTNIIDVNVTESLSGLNVTNGALEVRDENDEVIATGQVFNGTAVIPVGGLEAGKEYEFTVVYKGTNVYGDSSSTFRVTIPNTKLNIIPDPVNTMKIGESTDITGRIVDENNQPIANTLVNVTVDGHKLEVETNESGRYAYPYTANKTGNITVNVSVEQEGYDTASVEFNFTVVPVYTQVTATATSPIIVTNDTTVSGFLTDEYGKGISGVNVTVYINGVEAGNATTGTEGEYTYDYTTGVLGLNNVTVKYEGNGTYTASNATANFIVEQMITTVSVETVTPIKVGNNTTISGILTDRNGIGIAGQTINISVSNDEYEYKATTDDEGRYTINIMGETEGTYDVKVFFNGTEAYAVSNNTAKFTVEKYNVNIDVNITEPKSGSNTVNLNLTDEYGNPVTEGNVTLLDKDGNFLANVTIGETGLATAEITLEPGFQNITAVYNGTDKYKEANTTYVVNIPKYDPVIIVNDIQDTLVRNNTTISGYLVDENDEAIKDATLIIRVNDIAIATVITGEDGNYSVVYNATTIGEKDVTVSFEGNEMYAPTVGYGMFDVLPVRTNVTVPEIEDTVIGNVVVINGTLTDELEQAVGNVEVIITVNGKNYTASTDDDGKYTYNYTTGTAGVNNITVTFIGDENIIGTVNETTFNVIKIATATAANISSPRAGTNIIDINVTESLSGLNVTNGALEVRDETEEVIATGQVFNGTAVIPVGGLEAGKEYEFTVVYKGTNVYGDSSSTFKVTIPNTKLNIIPDPVNPMKVGESTNITGKVFDENNKPLANTEINVTVNGFTIPVTTDENGTYSYPYTANVTGNITVNVTVEQEGYDTASIEYNFTVDKIFTTLTVNATTPILISENTTIAGTLSEETPIGNALISIYINGEKVDEVTTDENGNYNYTATGNILGINNVTAVYEGNDTYEGVNRTTNFVVEKMFTAITVETVTPIKVGNNTTISGKLVDADNNPIKDATINITVGTDKYNTTTDNEGFYSINVTGVIVGDNNVTAYYEGNISYGSSTNKAKFIVEKHDADLDVEVINPQAGNSTINITVTDESGNPVSGGFVNITDENGNVIGNGTIDENGNLETNITLEPGKHEITVAYNGTDDSQPANKTLRIVIPPYKTSITVNAEDTEVRDTTEIKGKLESEGKAIPDADIVIHVGSQEIAAKTNSEGEYSVVYNATIAGEKQVTVEYTDETGKYDYANDTTAFDVSPIDTKVILDDIENIKVGNITNITGELRDYKDRIIPNTELTLTINGVNYTVQTNESGQFSQDYMGSIVGENNVTASFDGNNNFNANESKTSFNVSRIETTIEATPVTSTTGSTTIELNITDEEGNPIPYGPAYIEDEDGNIIAEGTIINGTLTAVVPTQPGPNKFNVVFNGTDKYQNASKPLEFEVPKYDSTITPTATPPVTIGDTTNITGRIIDENNKPVSGQPVNITINGENVTVYTDENGTYNYPYTTDTSGVNNVTVTLLENENYTQQSVSYNFTVDKKGVIIEPNVPEVISGEESVINGTIRDENNQPVPGVQVNITINGENVTVYTDENGTYTYNYTFTTPGENNITVTVVGGDEFETQNDTYKVYVDKKPTQTLFDNKASIKIGDELVINGTLLDNKGIPVPNADLKVEVAGQETTAKTDANGKYTAKLTPTKMGVNNITVSYAGNDTYKATNYTGTVNVDKLDTIITTNITNASRVDDNVQISGQLTDEKGKVVPNAKVVVNVNGQDYNTTTDSQGKFTVGYPSTKDGRHDVLVSYDGDDKHYPSDASRMFTLQKHDILVDSEVIPGPGEVTVIANVTDEKGNPIKDGNVTIITPNGTITVPVKDGKVNVTIPAEPGKQNIEIGVSAGDDYTPTVKQVSVDVPKIGTKLTVDPLKPAYAGDNVSVTGSLKDLKGKPVANANVTVKYGNTTQTVQTDANGNFKAQVPNVSSGAKNVTVTYAGNNTYETDTVNTTQNVTKRETVVTVDPVTGIVGENITLTAYIKDAYGAPISGGNIVFKLNGKTLRIDGRFDSKAEPMKLQVKDGKVTVTLVADLYLRSAKNLTAMYSGSYRYNSNTSQVVTAQIQKRSATVKVTATPSLVKQNTDVTFTATVTDVTKNHKNTTSVNQGGYVLFKVNGNTIKATNGSVLYVPVVNSQATYKYHVASGTGGITNDKDVRNYTVTAIYTNENFYPDNCRNTTVYNVQRSKVNVTISSAVVQDGILSVKGSLKDESGINVIGTSKVCVKINGATYKENGAYKYFQVQDGIFDLTGIKANTKTAIKTVEVVTGERQAYYAGKGSTTKITVLN